MSPTRRTVLRASAAVAAGLLLPAGCGFPVNTAQGSAGKLLRSTTQLPAPFRVPLPIPPVLKPSRATADSDFYDVTQRAASARILPGLATPIWGYNGIFPGPTIIARSGRQTVVRHRNELPVPTVTHLHGGVTPPESDGFPTDYVLPAAGFDTARLFKPGRVHEGEFAYGYPLHQRAATLWYHDHRMDFTGPSVWRGLAGFFLVRDDVDDALPLPSGDRDIPLMIADRSFAPDGTMPYPSRDPNLIDPPGVIEEFMSGVLGDCILVNGAPWPVLDVSDTRYRFRILNASNARRYRLTLDPAPAGAPFIQIGTGQGLLEAPVALDAIDIAQAERFDAIIDFSAYRAGTTVRLRNEHGDAGTKNVMAFHITHSATDASKIPERLSTIDQLSDADVVKDRSFVFAKGGEKRHGMTVWTISGKPFNPNRIDARVRKGTTERWTIRALNVPHPFHIHEDAFQVSDVNGNDSRGAYNAGWKDVVNLDNGGRGTLLIRFGGYPGTYVFHCHNLEHEDMMMMATFEIV